MNMKERLIKEYPLTRRVACDMECYELAKRRYAIFYNEKIEKTSIEAILETIRHTANSFVSPKTIVIIGDTEEMFAKEDLLYFNGVDTFVVFYLKNSKNNEIYYNDQRVFWFSVGWRKFIIRFNKILK